MHTCPCRYIETFIWMCLVYSADPPPLLIRKCTKIYQSIIRHKQLNGNEKKEAKKRCNNNKNVHLVYKTILLHPLYVRNVCVFHNLFIAGVSCCCVFSMAIRTWVENNHTMISYVKQKQQQQNSFSSTCLIEEKTNTQHLQTL